VNGSDIEHIVQLNDRPSLQCLKIIVFETVRLQNLHKIFMFNLFMCHHVSMSVKEMFCWTAESCC